MTSRFVQIGEAKMYELLDRINDITLADIFAAAFAIIWIVIGFLGSTYIIYELAYRPATEGSSFQNRSSFQQDQSVIPKDLSTVPSTVHSEKPKYKLIGLSGKFGVGKDTAAEWIVKKHPEYKVVAFASALKRIVAIMTSTTEESQYTREGKAFVPPGFEHSVGKYQQILGMLGREHFRDDIWVNIALNTPAEYKIITDVRFPNEVEAIKKAGGVVIRINRYGVVLNDGRDVNHCSETALDNYKFDWIIDNNGSLADFKHALFWFLS